MLIWLEFMPGTTCVMISPRPSSPSSLMKESAALLESVTNCDSLPARFSSLMMRAASEPEPITITACGLALWTLATPWPISPIGRLNEADAAGCTPRAWSAVVKPSNTSCPKPSLA
ncbi:hypothetical protein D3C85_1585440 [compost metagenome]